MTPTDEQRRAYADWLATRPEVIQRLGERFTPWSWWRMKSDPSGAWAYFPAALSEDGTARMVKVSVVTGEAVVNVFGISPEDVEPCDPPEVLRARMSPAEEQSALVVASVHKAMIDARVREVDSGDERN